MPDDLLASVIAHELAHAYLYAQGEPERAADELLVSMLVVEWGFEWGVIGYLTGHARKHKTVLDPLDVRKDREFWRKLRTIYAEKSAGLDRKNQEALLTSWLNPHV